MSQRPFSHRFNQRITDDELRSVPSNTDGRVNTPATTTDDRAHPGPAVSRAPLTYRGPEIPPAYSENPNSQGHAVASVVARGFVVRPTPPEYTRHGPGAGRTLDSWGSGVPGPEYASVDGNPQGRAGARARSDTSSLAPSGHDVGSDDGRSMLTMSSSGEPRMFSMSTSGSLPLQAGDLPLIAETLESDMRALVVGRDESTVPVRISLGDLSGSATTTRGARSRRSLTVEERMKMRQDYDDDSDGCETFDEYLDKRGV